RPLAIEQGGFRAVDQHDPHRSVGGGPRAVRRRKRSGRRRGSALPLRPLPEARTSHGAEQRAIRPSAPSTGSSVGVAGSRGGGRAGTARGIPADRGGRHAGQQLQRRLFEDGGGPTSFARRTVSTGLF